MAKHRFFYLMNMAGHRVFKHVDRVAQAELGVSAAQLGPLFVVARYPGSSQRELAAQLGYNESAITAQVRRLIEAELVERVPSPKDRRATKIELTAKGAEVVRRAQPLLARFNAMLMEGFEEAELDVAARFLEHAIEAFGSKPGSKELAE